MSLMPFVVALTAALACRGGGAELSAVSGGVADGPLVVAVHGLGDRPESLVRLVEGCGLPVRVVAPRGTDVHRDGFSWFDVAFEAQGVRFDEQEIAAAADALAALIGREARGATERPVVTGFSQGGVLAFAVAARHPGVVGLAVPVAGALPGSLVPSGPPPAGAARIRALHGAADALVPADWARTSVDGLRAAGWDAQMQVFDGVGHEVSAPVHEALCAQLSEGVSSGKMP